MPAPLPEQWGRPRKFGLRSESHPANGWMQFVALGSRGIQLNPLLARRHLVPRLSLPRPLAPSIPPPFSAKFCYNGTHGAP